MLLSDPSVFLVVILLFSLVGVMICFKKEEMRINSTILTLYPLLFHFCFMIFYWSNSTEVLIVTELICLGSYLIGLIHHILTLLYEIGTFWIKIFKNCCKSNKVSHKETTEPL